MRLANFLRKNMGISEKDQEAYDQSEETPQLPAQKVEITIKEAEILKISPKPGEVLLFKFKGEQFFTDDVNELGKQLRVLFPNNKVVVMALPDFHDVELTTVENQDKLNEVAEEPKDCSKPTSYCDNCACGKKERIESEKKDGDV